MVTFFFSLLMLWSSYTSNPYGSGVKRGGVWLGLCMIRYVVQGPGRADTCSRTLGGGYCIEGPMLILTF